MIANTFPPQTRYLFVSIPHQTLSVFVDNICLKSYAVSTAKNGAGEQYGSEKTPRGWHKIRAKIGHSAPLNSVFISRRPTGEIYTPELAQQHPNRDWILTRILWLCGLEQGFNRLGNIDTQRRFIYIHGAPDDASIGFPNSKGCIRMHNEDLIDLFDRVVTGSCIYISEYDGAE